MQQQPCVFDKTKVAATVSGCVGVKSGSESALKEVVSEVGPVSVAIDAGHLSFQLYAGGSPGIYLLMYLSSGRIVYDTYILTEVFGDVYVFGF